MAKIVQTAGRNALGSFAPEFAHFNDDVLFGKNWNNQDLNVKTRSIITVVALMASGITDSCLCSRPWLLQEEGKEAIEMKPGDCINIPAEVKHWHGAAPDSWFSHLAVEIPGEGTSNEWCEPVTDEEYNKLP